MNTITGVVNVVVQKPCISSINYCAVKEIVAEEKQSLAAALPDEKENKKDVKDVIMEKSGRTYNERNVVKQAEKLPAPEKEIRPEVEEQLKKYRENER